LEDEADAADGRIEDTPELQKRIEWASKMSQLAVEQTRRFGVEPFEEPEKRASQQYWDWYCRCEKMYLR